MLGRDAKAVIGDRDFGAAVTARDVDFDFAAIGCESLSIIDEIVDRTLEQNRIGIDFGIAAANNGNPSVFGHGPVKAGDFLASGTGVELFPLNRFACGIDPRNEKKIIYDAGEAFAFGHGRFDHFAIFLSGSLAS